MRRLVQTSQRSFCKASLPNVNKLYKPDLRPLPKLNAKDNSTGTVSEKHYRDKWTREEVEEALSENSLFTWGASDVMREQCVHAERAEGCYIIDDKGKDYFDMSSGAVCSNLGHTVPERVRQAVDKQLATLPFVYSDTATHAPRAKLSSLIADLLPADLNSVMFACGGAEANEGAIRIARKFTGRHKVMSRYRSYHGGTLGAVALTGDSRTKPVHSSVTGFVKMLDPFPMSYSLGSSQDEVTQACLAALSEQIEMEGPETIAAIFLETITGANGWLLPAPGYMEGVRALCDKHGILLVADEVMCGFGRTGKMFGFQHCEGVVPDIVTFAKGVSSAWLPLSGIAVRQPLMDFFRTNPVGYGLTYAMHPVSSALAYETIKYILEEDIVGHVKDVEPVYLEELGRLVDKHASVKQARGIGLAGGVDLANPETGEFLCGMHEAHPKVKFLKQRMREEGCLALIRGHFVHICPPLVATESELRDGFGRLSRCLDDLDRA